MEKQITRRQRNAVKRYMRARIAYDKYPHDKHSYDVEGDVYKAVSNLYRARLIPFYSSIYTTNTDMIRDAHYQCQKRMDEENLENTADCICAFPDKCDGKFYKIIVNGLKESVGEKQLQEIFKEVQKEKTFPQKLYALGQRGINVFRDLF